MEHEPLKQRLHALGEIEIEPALVAEHLGAMGRARRRSSLGRSIAVVASLAVVGGAAIVGVASAGSPTPNAVSAPPFDVPVSDPPPFDVPVSDPPPVSPPVGRPGSGRPNGPPPFGELSVDAEFTCVGPPPFAGTPAESGGRAAEALDFAEFRSTQCPASDDDIEIVVEPGAADVDDSDPCHGPPPFAGIPANGDVARAIEALLHAVVRSECQDDAPATPEEAESSVLRAVADVPAGPPADVPAGPPAGPPADVPAGPPADVPAGPPADVPAGPPADVPAGPPVDPPGNGQ
jgi:hypothetical protein